MPGKPSPTDRKKLEREQKLRGIAERHDQLIAELSALEERIVTTLANLNATTSSDRDGHSY